MCSARSIPGSKPARAEKVRPALHVARAAIELHLREALRERVVEVVVRGGALAVEEARGGDLERSGAHRHQHGARIGADLAQPRVQSLRGTVRAHHHDVGARRVRERVIRHDLEPAREGERPARLAHGEEAKSRLLGAGASGVLEDFPRSGEVDHVGALGDHEGDGDGAACGRGEARVGERVGDAREAEEEGQGGGELHAGFPGFEWGAPSMPRARPPVLYPGNFPTR